MSASSGILPEYGLCAEMRDHRKSVRDVAASGDDWIATAEEYGRIHVFKRTASNEFTERKVFPRDVHDNMIFSLEAVQSIGEQQFPQPTFASGGDESRIRVWTNTGNFYPDMGPHNGSYKLQIGSISQLHNDPQGGDFISGAWDGCAYIWKQGQVNARIEGHMYSTQVLGLPGGGFVTASANKEIHFYDASRKLLKRVQNAHGHVVKKLAYLAAGDLIYSAGNDGFIKSWTRRGDAVSSWQAHFSGSTDKGKEYDPFIFALCAHTNAGGQPEVVTGGEDAHVRIWTPQGQLIQAIPHPGPVNAVKGMPCGDLLVGCGDRCARVFTRHADNLATPEVVAGFEAVVAALQAVGGADMIDTESLASPEVLQKPGKKHGEVLVVRVPGRGAIAYSWDANTTEWTEIGEAFAQSSAPADDSSIGLTGSGAPKFTGSGKQLLEGREYDRVIPVEIDSSGQKTQIGFDLDEEPEDIAQRFLSRYGLPSDFRPQIIEFVRPLLDRDAARRKMQVMKYRREDDFKVIAAWRGSYQTFLDTNIPAMRTKILEFSAQLGGDQALTAAEEGSLAKIVKSLSDTTAYHSAPFPVDCHELLRKMSHWPTEKVAPVLDCARILMLQAEASAALSADAELQAVWFEHAKHGQAAHQAFVLRLLTNWVARRKKSNTERDSNLPDPAAVTLLSDSMSTLSGCASSDNKTVAGSFAMFIHNVAAWIGRFKVPDCDLYAQSLTLLAEFLARLQEEKSLYFGLIALGATCLANESQNVDLARAIIGDDRLKAIVQAALAGTEPLRLVGGDLKLLFKF